LVGLGIWVGIRIVSGTPEPWDSAYYGRYCIPLMIAAAGFCGLIRPRNAWRWGVMVVAPQAVVLFLFTDPGAGANLWPIGLCFFTGFSILCIGAAELGAVITGKTRLRTVFDAGPPYPKDHCRNCGYDLTGNESGRCPECGRWVR
jgi:hypothetical protein